MQSIFTVGNSSSTSTIKTSSSSSSSSDTATGISEVLQYQNSTIFYAEKVPGRFEKVGIFADDGEGTRGVRVEVYWEGV